MKFSCSQLIKFTKYDSYNDILIDLSTGPWFDWVVPGRPASTRRQYAAWTPVVFVFPWSPFFLFCIYYKLIRRELAAKPQLRVEKKKARRSLFDAAPTRRWSICESPKKKLFLFYFLSSVLACTCESAMVVWPARHHSWLGFSPDSTLARWYVSTLSILSRFFFFNTRLQCFESFFFLREMWGEIIAWNV